MHNNAQSPHAGPVRRLINAVAQENCRIMPESTASTANAQHCAANSTPPAQTICMVAPQTRRHARWRVHTLFGWVFCGVHRAAWSPKVPTRLYDRRGRPPAPLAAARADATHRVVHPGSATMRVVDFVLVNMCSKNMCRCIAFMDNKRPN